MKDNKIGPIFIVGLPRSGSTLWHNIFAKSEALCRMGEMHYLSPFRKDFSYYLKKNGPATGKEFSLEKFVDGILAPEPAPGITESFWIHDIGQVKNPEFRKNLIENMKDSDWTLGSLFKIIVDEYVKLHGKERACIKFPVYPSSIPRLYEWYPECVVIHINRDPRAMAVSRKNDPQGTRKKIQKYPYLSFLIKKIMVLFVVFQYRWTSRLHRKYMKKYSHYKLFQYEELLSNPQKTIEALCEHAGVEFKENMLHPDQGQPSSITNEKKAGFDKSAAFRWKKHISPGESKMISVLTRSAMKRFGYQQEVLERNIAQ